MKTCSMLKVKVKSAMNMTMNLEVGNEYNDNLLGKGEVEVKMEEDLPANTMSGPGCETLTLKMHSKIEQSLKIDQMSSKFNEKFAELKESIDHIV